MAAATAAPVTEETLLASFRSEPERQLSRLKPGCKYVVQIVTAGASFSYSKDQFPKLVQDVPEALLQPSDNTKVHYVLLQSLLESQVIEGHKRDSSVQARKSTASAAALTIGSWEVRLLTAVAGNLPWTVHMLRSINYRTTHGQETLFWLHREMRTGEPTFLPLVRAQAIYNDIVGLRHLRGSLGGVLVGVAEPEIYDRLRQLQAADRVANPQGQWLWDLIKWQEPAVFEPRTGGKQPGVLMHNALDSAYNKLRPVTSKLSAKQIAASRDAAGPTHTVYRPIEGVHPQERTVTAPHTNLRAGTYIFCIDTNIVIQATDKVAGETVTSQARFVNWTSNVAPGIIQALVARKTEATRIEVLKPRLQAIETLSAAEKTLLRAQNLPLDSPAGWAWLRAREDAGADKCYARRAFEDFYNSLEANPDIHVVDEQVTEHFAITAYHDTQLIVDLESAIRHILDQLPTVGGDVDETRRADARSALVKRQEMVQRLGVSGTYEEVWRDAFLDEITNLDKLTGGTLDGLGQLRPLLERLKLRDQLWEIGAPNDTVLVADLLATVRARAAGDGPPAYGIFITLDVSAAQIASHIAPGVVTAALGGQSDTAFHRPGAERQGIFGGGCSVKDLGVLPVKRTANQLAPLGPAQSRAAFDNMINMAETQLTPPIPEADVPLEPAEV